MARERTLHVRIDDGDLVAIRTLAKLHSLPMSGVIRMLVRKELRELRTKPTKGQVWTP